LRVQCWQSQILAELTNVALLHLSGAYNVGLPNLSKAYNVSAATFERCAQSMS